MILDDPAAVVLNHISAMVAYWTCEEVCLFANDAYQTWFGKSREEMLGISMKVLLGPLYEKNLPHIRGVLKGEAQIFEREIQLPTGEIRHSLATYTPDIVEGTVRGFVAHVANVTHLKAIERQLQETTEQFRAAMMAMQEGLVIQDSTGAVRLCNQAALETLELSEDELMGRTSFDPHWRAVHEDGTPWSGETRPIVLSRLEGRQISSAIMGVQTRHATLKWLQVNSSPIFSPDNSVPIGAIATFLDITQRKKDEEEREERARHDHRIAEVLQSAMLPLLPDTRGMGLTFHSVYLPTSDEAAVGGDFYDVFPLPNGFVGVMVGDIMGHGLDAAISISKVRFVLKGFLSEAAYPHPAEALERLNYFLCQSSRLKSNWSYGVERHRFDVLAALTLAVLDPQTGEGWIVVAGMEPPVLVRASSGEAKEINASGMLLGIDATSPYEAEEITLLPGDLLAIATDGLTEAYPRTGQIELSKEVLGRALRGAVQRCEMPARGKLEKFAGEIVTSSRAFAGGEFRDDLCLLLIRKD